MCANRIDRSYDDILDFLYVLGLKSSRKIIQLILNKATTVKKFFFDSFDLLLVMS